MRNAAPTASSTAAAVAPSYVPSATASSPPTLPPPLLVSDAIFDKKDVLIACLDISYTVPSGTPDDWRQKVTRAAQGPTKPSSDGTQTVHLQKPCAEQFAERPALASCAMPRACNDAGACRGSTITYYSLDTLRGSDLEMKDCLKMGGDWQGVSRDSPGYQQAVHDDARRQLGKAQKKLEQLSGEQE
jgi:hypothetical protein